MAYTCFDVTIADHVAHVRLNRPEALNSMTREFWAEIPAVMGELGDSGSVRAIVLSSTGRHFSAGMDLGVFAGGDGGSPNPAAGAEAGRRHARLWQLCKVLQDSVSSLDRVRVPVLAAIQGGCVGGAVDLVTAADLRYATEDAFFVVQEINIGMTADVGTLQRLPKLIPDGIAREMAYLGRRLPAQRAYEVGLVNGLYTDHDSLVAGVLDTAGEIAAKSPLAIWGSKESIRYARDHSVEDSLNFIATWQTGMFQPADMMETFAAQSDKRDPVFEDLLPPPTGI